MRLPFSTAGDKQIGIQLPEEIKIALQDKALEERRSLKGQTLKLLDDFREKEEVRKKLLKFLEENITNQETKKENTMISMRIPKDTFWQMTKIGADYEMSVKDLCKNLLRAWLKNALP